MLLLVESFLLWSLIVYCALKWLKYYKVPEGFPPGPPAVPVLGVLPFITSDFKAAIQGWREEYGEVVGVQLGSELAVFLSDYEVINTSFKDHRFTGRPRSIQKVMSAFFQAKPGEENGGIVFTHGQQWTEQRRFALKTLRDFGFGKKSMETVILDEVNKLGELLESQQKKCSGTLNHNLSVGVVNSIWTILTGQKIEQGDETVSEIVNGTEEFIKNESLSGPIMMMPWLLKFPFLNQKFNASRQGPLKMRQLQMKTVANHELELSKQDSNNNGLGEPKDFIESYLNKIKETTDTESSFYGDQGRLNLQRSLTDLFGAGSETSSTILLFAFLYMIKHPDIQSKVRAEVDSVCGSRQVCLDDRPNMPYTEAVLYEIMRHACLVYAVPHATTEAVTLEGYTVPAQTAVYANVWAVMRSEDYWGDADEFRPDRFISPSGKFRKDDHCIPFMVGRRYCIGQTLALNQLFLFFSILLSRFEFEAPGGSHRVSTEPLVGFLHHCPEYNVAIRTRA